MYLSLTLSINYIYVKNIWLPIWTYFETRNHFYAPGLKGPPGASSNWIVRPSVCPFVRPSVRNSVLLTNKVQYLKFG